MIFTYQNCAPVGSSFQMEQTVASEASSESDSTENTSNDSSEDNDSEDVIGDTEDEAEDQEEEDNTNEEESPPVETICTSGNSVTLGSPSKSSVSFFSGYGSSGSGSSEPQQVTFNYTDSNSAAQTCNATVSNNSNNMVEAGLGCIVENGKVTISIGPNMRTRCRSGAATVNVSLSPRCSIPTNNNIYKSTTRSISVVVQNGCLPNKVVEAPSPTAQAYMGTAVAMDSNRLVIAEEKSNSYRGAAHIFTYVNDVTGFEQTVIPSNSDMGTTKSVAISGDYVVTGAPAHNNFQGGVFVFHYSNNSWTQIQTITSPNPTADVAGQFGRSVALEGSTLVVGAPNANNGGISQGQVYVYSLSNGSFSHTKTFSGANLNYELFGQSVAIDNGNIVVGAPLDDSIRLEGQGSVYYFQSGASTYTRKSSVSVSHLAKGSALGWSVDISGTRIIAGAPLRKSNPNDASEDPKGKAFIFNSSDMSSYNALAADDDGGQHGYSVAISGNKAVVGANYLNSQNGAMFYYDLTKGTTNNQYETKYEMPSVANDDQFGQSAAMSGDKAVIGSPLDNVGIKGDAGSATLIILNPPNY